MCRSCFEPVKPAGLLTRLARFFGGGGRAKPHSPRVNIRLTERIKVRDARTGETKEYHSLDEVPAEQREQIRKAREAALTSVGAKLITVTDASGATHTYQSIDEMPPDLRAIYERARGLR